MTNATNSNIPAAQFYANDVDKDGNVWFTSSHYLLRYNGEDFKWWNCYGYHEARAIYCDDDAVYVLMQDDTLMKFQNEKFKTIDLTETVITETSESRGVDLGEYAFGIPADQLNFNNQSPFTLSFWVNIKEFNLLDSNCKLAIRYGNESLFNSSWINSDINVEIKYKKDIV